MLRGFAHHICPAASSYSWNVIAGHQEQTKEIFHQQLREEGIQKAVHQSRRTLPDFHGGVLDYHLKLFLPKGIRTTPFNQNDVTLAPF
jgi:hypothetical protein